MKPFPERNLDDRKRIFNDRLTTYEEIHGNVATLYRNMLFGAIYKRFYVAGCSLIIVFSRFTFWFCRINSLYKGGMEKEQNLGT